MTPERNTHVPGPVLATTHPSTSPTSTHRTRTDVSGTTPLSFPDPGESQGGPVPDPPGWDGMGWTRVPVLTSSPSVGSFVVVASDPRWAQESRSVLGGRNDTVCLHRPPHPVNVTDGSHTHLPAPCLSDHQSEPQPPPCPLSGPDTDRPQSTRSRWGRCPLDQPQVPVATRLRPKPPVGPRGGSSCRPRFGDLYQTLTRRHPWLDVSPHPRPDPKRRGAPTGSGRKGGRPVSDGRGVSRGRDGLVDPIQVGR